VSAVCLQVHPQNNTTSTLKQAKNDAPRFSRHVGLQRNNINNKRPEKTKTSNALKRKKIRFEERFLGHN